MPEPGEGQCGDDGPEQEDLVALVRPTEQDPGVSAISVGDQLLDQAGLADSGLAEDGDEPAATRPGPVEGVTEPAELDLASDQRRLRRWRLGRLARPRRSRRCHAGGRPLLEDLAIQPAGVGLRLRPEVVPQDVHALLVLAEGGAPLPQLGVQAHQRAVHRFL